MSYDPIRDKVVPRFTRGGKLPTKIADGERIDTPERAEQLGLTADAKRMRRLLAKGGRS